MTSSREPWLSFPTEIRCKTVLNIDLNDLPMERTLGRIWQGESDTFTFLLNIEEEADKKRKIVISVANIFDPMVFLACCHFQDSRLAAVKEGKGWQSDCHGRPNSQKMENFRPRITRATITYATMKEGKWHRRED